MKAGPRVAVVVPVHNKLAWTLRFLQSFAQVRHARYEIVVVDDGSTDGTAEVLARAYPCVTVLRGDGHLWWAGATNLGVRHALDAGYPYILTINNDTHVDPDFLEHLLETAEENPRSIVGSRINCFEQPTRVWAIGSSMDWIRGQLFHLSDHGRDEATVLAARPNPCPVEVLTGCGTLVPAQCYREVGLYDARRYPQYHADAELVLRAARKGYRALVDLRAVVWNDTRNTSASEVRRYYDFFFSQRSAVYWRPIMAVHLDYCPRHLLIPSLMQYYTWFMWFHDPLARKLKRLLKRLLGRTK